MAIRREELYETGSAVVVPFPTARARARAARHSRMLVRRRRTLAAATFASIVVAGIFATGPSGSSSASAPGTPRRITVHAGETLWGIAERYAPGGVDLRAYVDALAGLNDLEGGVVAGQRLRLPK